MFGWDASNTYFKDLMTAEFGGGLGPSFPGGPPTVGLRSGLDRADPWPKVM